MQSSKEEKALSKLFQTTMGFAPSFSAPTLLSEKLWAMRLQPPDPLHAVLANAENQRELLQARQCERHLLRSYGTFRSFREIPWKNLPKIVLLAPVHCPEAGVLVSANRPHWKHNARGAIRRLFKVNAFKAAPVSGRFGKHLLRREYTGLPPAIQVLEAVEGKRLCAICLQGSVRAYYWQDVPQTLFSPAGEPFLRGGESLRLYPNTPPGSLAELTAFCEAVSLGFPHMHLSLLVTETTFRFETLCFFEDEQFLRTLPREIDRDLGSYLKNR